MKNLRKAALAVATASAVAFAGTSVAGAQTDEENIALTQISSESESSLSSDKQSEDASGSKSFLSRIGKVLGADQYVDGAQLWGFQHCWHQRPEEHGPHQGWPVTLCDC